MSKIILEIIDVVEITQSLRCDGTISIGIQTLISKIYRRLNTDVFSNAPIAPDTPIHRQLLIPAVLMKSAMI